MRTGEDHGASDGAEDASLLRRPNTRNTLWSYIGQEVEIKYTVTLREKMLTADPSKAIRAQPFKGSHHGGQHVVVSFPGVHGDAWNILTGQDEEFQRRSLPSFTTTCVFLPKREHGLFEHGKHACYCDVLAKNSEKPIPEVDGEKIGCLWYEIWTANTQQAYGKSDVADYLVVTKLDGTLGNSQRAEKKFLEQSGCDFKTISIEQFADLAINSVDAFNVSEVVRVKVAYRLKTCSILVLLMLVLLLCLPLLILLKPEKAV
ncbi:unnamed protein product [Symbiodinium natans]|uniref:Uncharacterized protein n=1 Tax=Symbiodinium natans TaxID=878477 RepID=A0A812IDA2_9DINO|nr:unnamed protein product [Symbiodinium natans]